jgi:hypothetical protein
MRGVTLSIAMPEAVAERVGSGAARVSLLSAAAAFPEPDAASRRTR